MEYQFTYEYEGVTFSEEHKRLLRPIAETLAMMDGNAFFTVGLDDDREYYEQYLAEAAEIFFGNGGLKGWASEASWVKEHLLREKHPALKNAWEQYQILKELVKNDKD